MHGPRKIDNFLLSYASLECIFNIYVTDQVRFDSRICMDVSFNTPILRVSEYVMTLYSLSTRTLVLVENDNTW